MNECPLPLSIYEQVPCVKIVFIGDSSVGKSSIINVTQNREVNPEQPSTIGACFYIMKLLIGNFQIKLHIWDTAGQERFRSLTPQYYRDADYAVIVYSINNAESFNSVDNWCKSINNNCPKAPKIVLLGNKADLSRDRQVSAEKGKQMADSINAEFYETSAKTMKKEILKLFQQIGECMFHEMMDRGEIDKNSVVSAFESDQKSKKCC